MTMTSESVAPAVAGPARFEVRRPARDEWIELAAGFADHNYRHCWDYAERLSARPGARAAHAAVAGAGAPLRPASARGKGLPGARTRIAFVSGGPPARAPR